MFNRVLHSFDGFTDVGNIRDIKTFPVKNQVVQFLSGQKFCT